MVCNLWRRLEQTSTGSNVEKGACMGLTLPEAAVLPFLHLPPVAPPPLLQCPSLPLQHLHAAHNNRCALSASTVALQGTHRSKGTSGYGDAPAPGSTSDARASRTHMAATARVCSPQQGLGGAMACERPGQAAPASAPGLLFGQNSVDSGCMKRNPMLRNCCDPSGCCPGSTGSAGGMPQHLSFANATATMPPPRPPV